MAALVAGLVAGGATLLTRFGSAQAGAPPEEALVPLDAPRPDDPGVP